MLPLINGKDFLECTKEDLDVLIGNSDYRENEYLDYKETFSHLEIKDRTIKEDRKSEFKSDVCSFANADGGYLIYGVSEKLGCADKIIGITIFNSNTDKFELDIRNSLNGIMPKVPTLQFHFINLDDDKYIVIIKVFHDFFSPYMFVHNESNYRVFKRNGNGKKTMAYFELRQMFNSSMSLERELSALLVDEIQFFSNLFENKMGFMLFSVVPETFLDKYFNKNMYVAVLRGEYNFTDVFSPFRCNCTFIPSVDGIKYLPYHEGNDSCCMVRNNRVIESGIAIDQYVLNTDNSYEKGFLQWRELWEMINGMISALVKQKLYNEERVFLNLALVGCCGITTESDGYITKNCTNIDRDELICEPIELINMLDEKAVEITIKKLKLSFLMALGIKKEKSVNELVNELYENG